MTDKSPFPDPTEATAAVRQAAEKSVEQARKAFDDVMSMTQKAMADAETNAAQVQGRMRDVTRETLDFAQGSAEAAFDLAAKLFRAKDPQEAMAIQKSFIEAQMERLGQQARSMSDGAIKAAQDLTKGR